MFLIEQERIIARKDPRASTPANEIPGGVTHRGRDVYEQSQQVDVEKSTRRKESGGNEKRVTGQKKTDEKARFGEDDRGETEIPGPFDEGWKIAQVRKQLMEQVHEFDVRGNAG